MGDLSGKFDVEKLTSYSDDLVAVLKEKRDINNFTHCLEHCEVLRSSCNTESDDVLTLLRGYEKKLDECKRKTEKAKFEISADDELELLQKELEREIEKERLLMQELRYVFINKEVNNLEGQRISVEEQRQHIKKLEQEELRFQRKLSMYASVANVIPNLDDHSKVSGYVVDRDKQRVEVFEFDPSEMNAFDTCQSIWKLINLR